MAIEQDESLQRSFRILFGAGTTGGQSDGQLLDRFLTGRDEAAFEALVARHGRMVLDVCRNVLGDPHDVEDAFQATFLTLARRAGSIRSRDALGSWLFGVARRVASRSRADAARRRALERKVAALTVEGFDRGEPSPDLAGLHEEIGKLPEKYREPVVLCYLEGMTHEAAAERLGCPVGTVSVRLKRARERLRRGLTRRGLAVPAGLLTVGVGVGPGVASAAMPSALVNSTIRTAIQGTASLGVFPAPVETLSRGVLNAMGMTKLMTGTGASLLLLTALALGMQGLANSTDHAGATEETTGNHPSARSGAGARQVRAGELEKVTAIRTDEAISVAFSPDGKTVVSGGADSTVGVWDAATGEKRSTLKGHEGRVCSVAFAPGGKVVASVGNDEFLRLWDVATGDLKRKLPFFSTSMLELYRLCIGATLAYSPDGKSLVVGGLGLGSEQLPGFELRLIDAETGRMRWGHIGHVMSAFSVSFAPDGKTLVSAGPTGAMIWDAKTGDVTQNFPLKECRLSDVKFSPDGSLLVGVGSGLPGRQVILWEVGTGAVRWRQETPRPREGRTRGEGRVAFSPDGKSVAVGGCGTMKNLFSGVTRTIMRGRVSEVKLLDVATGNPRWTWEGLLGEVSSLAYSPDGKKLVVCDRSFMGFIDVDTGKTDRTLMKTTFTPQEN